MRFLYKKFGYVFSIIIIAFLFLTGCQKHSASHHSGINVVTSVNFYGNAARAVLGQRGHVTSLISNLNVNPHDFTPTAHDAEVVSNANVIIDNGLGYDNWMNSLMQDAPHAHQVQIGKQLLHKKMGANPHIWYQLQTMPKLVGSLSKQFSRQDPAHQKLLQQNAQRYVKSLHPLLREIHKLKRERRQSRVDVSKPVFNYSLHAMGSKFTILVTPKRLKTGLIRHQRSFTKSRTILNTTESRSLSKILKLATQLSLT